MKYPKDQRVNTKTMSFRNYLVIFLTIMAVCGFCVWIYLGQESGIRSAMDKVYILLSILIYIVAVSVVILFCFAVLYNRGIMMPIRRLSDGARRVARGDYSVFLPPYRRDGKKDELEVLYEDFNAMVAELASTEALQKDFIANVSHELKTPLAVIQNYATILQSAGLEETERREYTARIGAVAGQLSVQISNILQLSRVESRKIVPLPRPYNLSEQLCRCALGFEQIWEEREICFETDLDQNIILSADEELLDAVWNNLISNALKFTPPGGSVSITAVRLNGRAAVTVADTGCGMTAEEAPRIFDKFYQADPSHATEGNGLGLAMVKEILALTGGEISVETAPGKGSAFTVSLPL